MLVHLKQKVYWGYKQPSYVVAPTFFLQILLYLYNSSDFSYLSFS